MSAPLGTRPARAVESIRLNFPALLRKQNGAPVAYFDGPGGTQVPVAVVEAMTDYLLHHNANTHWVYPTSVETDRIIQSARVVLADFVHGAPNEIVFGQNMTTLTFHLARALGRAWGPQDEIVITELDHHANQAPWTRLSVERGVTIRTVRVNPETGTHDWADLEAAITSRTRLLAIGAASNALGTVTDVARAAALAKAVGALVFVDAVHYAPHHLVDVAQLGCDFLACSAYKFYGPHIGILWGRHELLDALDVPKLAPAPSYAPDKLETGTQSHESIAGAAAAVEYLANIGAGPTRRDQLAHAFHALHERGHELVTRLWNGLGEIRGVTRYGVTPDQPRTPTVSFAMRGVPSEQVARTLAAQGLYVSNGDFYATTVVERLGHAADGLVRVGAACYTTAAEIERLLAGIDAIATSGG
ncbi:MAG: cysteine desulfurase-like protein [Gemmatimonadaceae bacterium]|nr:cysteine desulfurase-like protein [Gemmatimonadaceae bacterium]